MRLLSEGGLTPEQINLLDFSMFDAPISNTTKSKTTSIPEIFSLIKGVSLKEKTKQVRTRLTDKTLSLPSVVFSGVFKERRDDKRIKKSSLICIDIDGLSENLEEAKNSITSIDQVVMAFVSPGGYGLKVIMLIDEEFTSFQNWYFALSKELSERCSIDFKHFDQKCSNISRACLICHDPNAFINPIILKRWI